MNSTTNDVDEDALYDIFNTADLTQYLKNFKRYVPTFLLCESITANKRKWSQYKLSKKFLLKNFIDMKDFYMQT